MSLLHIVLSAFLMVQTMVGNARGADLILRAQGPAHERAYVWSTVLTLGCGFILPFTAPLVMPVTTNVTLAIGVVFAPLAGLGLLLSYLPLRLFVFYNVTRSESRVEVVSLAASFVFLCVQVVSERPH